MLELVAASYPWVGLLRLSCSCKAYALTPSLKLLQAVAALCLVLSKLFGAAGFATGHCTSKLLLYVLFSSISSTVVCVLEAFVVSSAPLCCCKLEAVVVVVVVVVVVLLDLFVEQQAVLLLLLVLLLLVLPLSAQAPQAQAQGATLFLQTCFCKFWE